MNGKLKVLMLTLTTLAIPAAILSAAGTAQAYTVTVSGSYPGTAQVPAARLVPDPNPLVPDPLLISDRRTIYESPWFPNRTQYVCITHRPLLFDPGNAYVLARWTVFEPWTACGYIPPAARSIFDNGYVFQGVVGCNAYSLDVVITWRLDGPTGALLGKKIYNYNQAGDYQLTPGTSRSTAILLGRFSFAAC